jgi:hypothetical protein
MNCRSCQLVDEQKGIPGGGNRTYADFGRHSTLPPREDGKLLTPRNSPPLVNASLNRRDFFLHFVFPTLPAKKPVSTLSCPPAPNIPMPLGHFGMFHPSTTLNVRNDAQS